MTGQTPPGWYPDPYGSPGLQRWWDGGQWTQSTQPAASTPAPWASPQAPQQPQTPQPWAPSATPAGQPGWPGGTPPRRNNQTAVWAVLGGGALVVILLAVVIVLVTSGGDDDPPPVTQRTTQGVPTPPNLQQSGRSPVVGTINDSRTGLAWPQLGGDWKIESVPAETEYGKLGLTQGETAVVQANYKGDGVSNYVASIYGAELPSSVSSSSLETAAKAYFTLVRPKFYPENTIEDVASRAHDVGGKKGWYYEVKVNFDQADEQGWNFRSERAIIVLVERPGKQPAALYLSVPDSHKNQGDIDLVLSSLRAS